MTHLSQILREESVWHDSKSKDVFQLLFLLIVLGACIILIVATLIFNIIYRRRLQTQEINAENIIDLHPCTILRLKNWNRPKITDITESIMYLEDCKIIKVIFGNDGNYYLQLTNKNFLQEKYAHEKLDDIDAETIELIFNKINKGNTTVCEADIYNYASARSLSFIESYNRWADFLKEKTRKLAGFKTQHKRIRRSIYVVALALFIASCLMAIFSEYAPTAAAGAFGALVLGYIANSLRNRVVVKNTNGRTIDIKNISMLVNPEKKQASDFKLAFDKVLQNSLKTAQTHVQFYNK